ncbi:MULTISPECIES: L-aspartate oxidase [unclassified Brevibacterium]|uniref:L-aspartate oxidase n=1 Tax=unclassified Brevibacterium TaxID=2614124 RepID=UPI0010F7FEBC|nr:L-aspartate oxidase [Brevibacterium sp. 2SA]MCM1011644.1 L-aspartate oxidase [Brevibacterium sp. XM4083]
MGHVVVIGSGIAGLTTARHLAGAHEVTLVTKDRLGDSNTALAQGGIAGVLSPDDSAAAHIADTLTAGVGLCDASAVRVLCTEGPARIRELAETGVRFDRRGGTGDPGPAGGLEPRVDPLDPAGWERGLEGAHSAARIYHSGRDATGRAIVEALGSAVRTEADAGRIAVRTETMLVDLVTGPAQSAEPAAAAGAPAVTGVRVHGRDGVVECIAADAVVLATGGAGQLFAHTTNPPAATGDGLAAAIRAGAAVSDLEFVQFHPTAFAGSGFLVSEAVRGAGALLRDARGRRFMPAIDPRAELAPRNVVALALRRTMAGQNGRPCHLDARAIPDVDARFPSIAAHLSAHGLSLADDLIPVTPAAHYVMGGITTDLEGRTSLEGLFAVGEAACTGVHGANRLASNSLLEGAVFGARAAAAITADLDEETHSGMTLAGTTASGTRAEENRTASAPNRETASATDELHRPAPLSRTALQALAWQHLGLERTAAGLTELLDHLGAGSNDRPGTPQGDDLRPSDDVVLERHDLETANLTLIARTMAGHALARTESIGAHVRTDEPHRPDALPDATCAEAAPAASTPVTTGSGGRTTIHPHTEEAASC